jgi:hypothetical protein
MQARTPPVKNIIIIMVTINLMSDTTNVPIFIKKLMVM